MTDLLRDTAHGRPNGWHTDGRCLLHHPTERFTDGSSHDSDIHLRIDCPPFLGLIHPAEHDMILESTAGDLVPTISLAWSPDMKLKHQSLRLQRCGRIKHMLD